MFQSIRHKILLVVAICASITLLGFFAVYWLTLEQQQSLEKQHDLPEISQKWFALSNAIQRAAGAQQAWLISNKPIFLKERNLAWTEDIHPAFNQLGLLYKKARVWEGQRAVERRSFYDLRLLILTLEDQQQTTAAEVQNLTQKEAETYWSEVEWPLVQKISKQIELLVRWQTDFARQQNSQLRQGFSQLGIWIWIVASAVLLLVLVFAVFFAKRITAPLRKLRSAALQVTRDQFHAPAGQDTGLQDSSEIFADNADEVQTLTDVFYKMEAVIRERTALLETTNRQLDQASRAKGMYLINMSHELRTPLNAIIGFAEVLLDSGNEKELSGYQKDRLGRILKSGQHLLGLINSLLDLSKIEAGQMELTNSEFQLENLLRDVIEWLEPLLQEKSLRHELIFEPNVCFLLYSDIVKIRQVLINLVGNAIKFSASGGHIEINCAHAKNGISIAVKDTGYGIPDEQQQQIFEVFQQIKAKTANSEKGTGLGLALVQSLMELMGGSVSLQSKPDTGSTFTIHFPESSCNTPES